jgi:hypothetical protein
MSHESARRDSCRAKKKCLRAVRFAPSGQTAALTSVARMEKLYNMKRPGISVAEARRNFAGLLGRAARTGARIRVRRYRTTLAGIISRADLQRLEECDDAMRVRRPAKPRRRTPRKQRAR